MTHIKVANAPCSWGTLEFEGMQAERIDYRRMLDELVDTGYTATELGDWGFMPTDPATLHAELSQRNLPLLGAYIGVALREAASHAPGEATALKIARLLADVAERGGQAWRPYLVLADDNATDSIRTQNAGRITPAMGLTEAAWETFVVGAERIARAVKQETGLPTVFHHHCAGFVETHAEIETLLRLTDPDLIGLVFDTGHYTLGANPTYPIETTLNKFASRIKYVHLKDCHPGVTARMRSQNWDYLTALKHGIFCELGQGCVDFPAVLDWLTHHDYQGWVMVEQDLLPGMGTPKESARRNREYLQSIGL